jgi:hypothetical protein
MDQEKTALQGCELCKYSIGVEPEPGRGYRVKGVDVAYMEPAGPVLALLIL